MEASPRSLERMIESRLRRWGLKPLRRGGQVFICNPTNVKLRLGDFFTIMEFDNELKIARSDEPIMSVLNNRVQRWTNPTQPWENYVAEEKKDADYKRDQALGALGEMLEDVSKIKVQVK